MIQMGGLAQALPRLCFYDSNFVQCFSVFNNITQRSLELFLHKNAAL